MFQHTPLDLTKKLIRVIQVLPDSDEKPISCSIRVIPVTAEYLALSYTWGCPSPTYQISVDGESFQVQENLHDFLRYFRRRFRSTKPGYNLIFVDAICIDQSNLEERNHQVRQMSKVYCAAQRVISWLGQGDERVELLLSRLSTLFAREHGTTERRRTYMATVLFEWRGFLQNLKLDDRLAPLCSLPYWKRLWIVPEVTLTRRLYFAYGKIMVAKHLLFDFLYVLTRYVPPRTASGRTEDLQLQEKLLAYGDTIKRHNLNNFLSSFNKDILDQRRNRTKFQRLAYAYGGNECYDCRDRVFALAGLSSDLDVSYVDYNESTLSLFTKVLYQQQEQLAGLELLRLARTLATMLDISSATPNLHALKDTHCSPSKTQVILSLDWKTQTNDNDRVVEMENWDGIREQTHSRKLIVQSRCLRLHGSLVAFAVSSMKEPGEFVIEGVLSRYTGALRVLQHKSRLFTDRQNVQPSDQIYGGTIVFASQLAFLELVLALRTRDLWPETSEEAGSEGVAWLNNPIAFSDFMKSAPGLQESAN